MIAVTTPDAARYVADHLRIEDKTAIAAWTDEDPAELAYFTATTSTLSWVIFAPDGEPVAMFGADGERGEADGSPWMYSTAKVSKVPLTLVKAGRAAIASSRDLWPALRLDAEPRGEKQTAFLKFMGFRESARSEKNGKQFVEMIHAE